MNKGKESSRFINNTVMQYIMTFATYVFPLITFPYLTRILEPELYGVITYLTATISYFQLIIDFGFNLSATKDIAEHQKDKMYIGGVLGSVIQAKLILAFCSLVIYSMMIPFVPIMHNHVVLAYLYIGIAVLSMWLPDFLFRGIEKMGIITIRFLVSQTIVTVLTFIVVQSKDDIIWVPVLRLIGLSVAIILTWYQIRMLGIKIQYSDIKNAIGKLKESSIYFISIFATTAFGATNTFMLGIMALPEAQIAYWGVSYNLISAAQSLYSPIINSLYPHMVARKDFRLVKRILLVLMPAIILTTIVVFMFSKPIIQIICGSKYIGAVPIFKALLPVLIISFPAMVVGFPVLGVIGKVKETTTTIIISSVFHIIGLIILAVVGKFTIFNIAILRSLTEAVLLGTRGYVLVDIKTYIKRLKYLKLG